MLSTDKVKTPTLVEAIDEALPRQDDFYENVVLPWEEKKDFEAREAYEANSD